ncbi:MAG TPA: peptidase M20, partial [Caulobacteraceae bacterium]
MNRLLALVVAVLGAVVVAAWAVQPPAALPADAPATAFSAGRAFADIREIARAPHVTGSAENARVRDYLAGRMRAL